MRQADLKMPQTDLKKFVGSSELATPQSNIP